MLMTLTNYCSLISHSVLGWDPLVLFLFHFTAQQLIFHQPGATEMHFPHSFIFYFLHVCYNGSLANELRPHVCLWINPAAEIMGNGYPAARLWDEHLRGRLLGVNSQEEKQPSSVEDLRGEEENSTWATDLV